MIELARGMSTEELAHYVERSKKGVEHIRGGLHFVQRTLAKLDNEVSADIDISAIPHQLRDRESLVAMQEERRRALTRYEDALRITLTVLGERRQ